jgi:hypothetical protein
VRHIVGQLSLVLWLSLVVRDERIGVLKLSVLAALLVEANRPSRARLLVRGRVVCLVGLNLKCTGNWLKLLFISVPRSTRTLPESNQSFAIFHLSIFPL